MMTRDPICATKNRLQEPEFFHDSVEVSFNTHGSPITGSARRILNVPLLNILACRMCWFATMEQTSSCWRCIAPVWPGKKSRSRRMPTWRRYTPCSDCTVRPFLWILNRIRTASLRNCYFSAFRESQIWQGCSLLIFTALPVM